MSTSVIPPHLTPHPSLSSPLTFLTSLLIPHFSHPHSPHLTPHPSLLSPSLLSPSLSSPLTPSPHSSLPSPSLLSPSLPSPLTFLTSHQVVRMALQVIATLSTSRAGLELESSSSSSSSSSSKAVSKSTTPTPTPHPHLNKYFRMLLLELLKMFNSSKTLLERKGSFIIRYE